MYLFMRDQAEDLRRMMMRRQRRSQRVIAVSSGKGGVGKTNISINLAIALGKLGARVLVIDADLGLSNVNVILGTTPDYSLYHVVEGQKKLSEVIMPTDFGISYIAGSTGFSNMANLPVSMLSKLISGIDSLENIDIIILDTGAGISRTILSFVLAADETIIIATPESTSMINAYGIIKSISSEKDSLNLNLVINRAASVEEAKKVSDRLVSISRQFLDIDLNYLGFVFDDKIVQYSVTHQIPFYVCDPQSHASLCVENLARKLLDMPEVETKGLKGFFNFLMDFYSRNER